ncbi:hypothetical protein DPMN_116247 [Dreissena polymorpha]|uniref:Uncharacterized protein n=1 Tax=Dreissena polymorpha TaxID=45954 RepID=A0A9D4QTS7_DREPO|nr:hypothetical protein DPMN_116247 [Dreissena polymorpha]
MCRVPRMACHVVARSRSHDHERRGLIHPKTNASLKAQDDGGDCAGKLCVDSATVKEADTNSDEKQSSRTVDDQSTQHGKSHSDLPTEIKSTGKTKKKKKKKKRKVKVYRSRKQKINKVQLGKKPRLTTSLRFFGNVQRGVNATNGAPVAIGSAVAIKLNDNQTKMKSIGTFPTDRSAEHEVCLEARETNEESKNESDEDNEQLP